VTGPALNGINSFDVNGAGQITSAVFDACQDQCAAPPPLPPQVDYFFVCQLLAPQSCGPPLSFLESVVTGNFVGGADLTFTPVTTPIPAALPLFASGLGALGLFSWRRKRKAQTGSA
jgi:hypothetical protein